MDVSTIKKKLYSLRLKVRALFLIEGLAKCMLVTAAFAIVTFVLDYAVGLRFPLPVRMVLLAGGAGALAYVFYRYLWYPVTTPLSDDDLALCVERGYPFLSDRLVCSLQLARSAHDDPFTSSEMVAALVAETNGIIETVRFHSVAKAAHVIVYLLAVVVLAGPIAVFCMADRQGLSDIWLRRYVLMSRTDWPRLTDVWLYSVNTDTDLSDILIPQGADVTIEANTGRKQPGYATIIWISQDGTEQSDAMTPRPPAKKGDPKPFRYTIKEVAAPFSFYVQAGDAQTPPCKVKVVERPKVKGNPEVSATLPPYLPRQLKFNGDSGGYVRGLPVGSELTVSVLPTCEVDSDKVSIIFPDEAGKAAREPIHMSPAANGRFSATFPVYKNLAYSIAMTRTYYRSGARPVPVENADRGIKYEVICEPDKAPTISITYPTEDKPVTAQSKINIKGFAADDYELGRIQLEYAVLQHRTANLESLEWKSRTIVESNPADIGYQAAKEYTIDYSLNLVELGVKTSEFVLYRLVAEDGCHLDAPDEKEAYDLAVARATKVEETVGAAVTKAGIERPSQISAKLIAAAIGKLEKELAGTPDAAKSEAVAVLKEALPLYQDIEKKQVELRSRSGPNVGTSAIMVMQVLTTVDVQGIMYEKVRQLRSMLIRLAEKQMTLKEDVTKMVYNDEYFQGTKFRVGDYLETQQLITKNLRNLSDEFLILARELEEAGVFEEIQKIITTQDGVGSILQDAAEGPSSAAAGGIAQMQLLIADQTTIPPAAIEIKRQIAVGQVQVLQRINDALNILPRIEDLREAIRGLQNLHKELDDIRKLLEEMAKPKVER